MDKLLSQSYKKLKNILSKMDSVLIAYSGGVDSSLLLKVACDVLARNVLAVVANSATYPKNELIFAKKMAKQIGARCLVIKTEELKNNDFLKNSLDRCYFCKRELFSKLNSIAKANRLQFVADGSNLDDRKDFRPGSLAKKEFHIRSPLAEAGLTKKDIRSLSKYLHLATWDKPSMACLASRILYGTKITEENLLRIDQVEVFLKSLGFNQVRAREYNGLCRIEVDKKQIPKLLTRRAFIVDSLKKLGYNYVTVDLEGYRTGSMNQMRPSLTHSVKGMVELDPHHFL